MTLGNLVRHRPPVRRVVRRPASLFTHDWDRLMGDLWDGFPLAPVPVTPQRFNPVFEAVELEDAYRVTAELPGVDASDLDVTVDDGVVSIKGRRRFEDVGEDGENEELGRFERRIRFPGDVVESEAKAVYKNGLLTVTVPKPVEAKPEVRTIPVETA